VAAKGPDQRRLAASPSVAGIVTDTPPTHEVVARLAELGVPVVQAAAGPG
jgi:hypothetical protein